MQNTDALSIYHGYAWTLLRAGLLLAQAWARAKPGGPNAPPQAMSVHLDDTESEILTIFCYFLAASATKNCEKIAVIQSAASAASAKGGCASSQLDHGLKFYVIWGGCASSRLIHDLSDCE